MESWHSHSGGEPVDFDQEDVVTEDYADYGIMEEARFRPKDVIKEKVGPANIDKMKIDFIRGKTKDNADVLGVLMAKPETEDKEVRGGGEQRVP